jgi:hypothetical protein
MIKPEEGEFLLPIKNLSAMNNNNLLANINIFEVGWGGNRHPRDN